MGIFAERTSALFPRLAEAYSGPGRHYHTLQHLREVLEVLDGFRHEEPSPVAEVAAWFHDVVYDPRRADNEERSAEWMRRELVDLEINPDFIHRAAQLILFTQMHNAPGDDRAAAILLDADLAILGSSPERYAAYAEAIRREYAWVPESVYRKGRTNVLNSFLQRARIYQTHELFTAREMQARENLGHEIATLAMGS
jgi:predicted metal-dependent HD superfamily phosphohydrolase